MKQHIRSVLANPNTGIYCHWYKVDSETFDGVIANCKKPHYNESLDDTVTYYRLLKEGGSEAAAMKDIKSGSYYILEYSKERVVA